MWKPHLNKLPIGMITQDEYDKKAYELKNRQYELKRVIEADESYSITLITLLNICSRAPVRIKSSDFSIINIG